MVDSYSMMTKIKITTEQLTAKLQILSQHFEYTHRADQYSIYTENWYYNAMAIHCIV